MAFPEADASYHTPTPEAFRALYDTIGVSRAQLARKAGICERRARYLYDGYKTVRGARVAVVMTYPEQVVFELLAWATTHHARKK